MSKLLSVFYVQEGVLDTTLKFFSDLGQISGFLQVLWFSPPIKLDHHNIAEILLKVALNDKSNQTIYIHIFSF
jgi:hypothetical protein